MSAEQGGMAGDMSPAIVTGSCLCGAVCYEICGPLESLVHCHCTMCRKAHGAAFGTYARVRSADFHWTNGAGDVARFRSSPQVVRTFCRTCGATLQFVRDLQEYFSLAVGTLDCDPGVRPARHIWVRDRAPWWHIDDDLPRFLNGQSGTLDSG